MTSCFWHRQASVDPSDAQLCRLCYCSHHSGVSLLHQGQTRRSGSSRIEALTKYRLQPPKAPKPEDGKEDEAEDDPFDPADVGHLSSSDAMWLPIIASAVLLSLFVVSMNYLLL